MHSALVKALSEPLRALISNGTRKESKDKIVVLDDIDVETFSLFAEYCYTGNYRVDPKSKAAPQAASGIISAPKQGAKFPFGSPYCACPNDGGRKCMSCRREKSQTSLGPSTTLLFGQPYCSCPNDPALTCVSCGKEVQRVDRTPAAIDSSALWTTFKSGRFGALNLDPDKPRQRLYSHLLSDEPSAAVTQHAKLYVMADRYLLRPLKDLTLYKLHRDLLVYTIDSNNDAEEIAKLLRLSYDGTPEVSELRDLVVTFAAARAERLVKRDAFKSFLEDGGEAVVDFTCRVSGRLT